MTKKQQGGRGVAGGELGGGDSRRVMARPCGIGFGDGETRFGHGSSFRTHESARHFIADQFLVGTRASNMCQELAQFDLNNKI